MAGSLAVPGVVAADSTVPGSTSLTAGLPPAWTAVVSAAAPGAGSPDDPAGVPIGAPPDGPAGAPANAPAAVAAVPAIGPMDAPAAGPVSGPTAAGDWDAGDWDAGTWDAERGDPEDADRVNACTAVAGSASAAESAGSPPCRCAECRPYRSSKEASRAPSRAPGAGRAVRTVSRAGAAVEGTWSGLIVPCSRGTRPGLHTRPQHPGHLAPLWGPPRRRTPLLRVLPVGRAGWW